jgi:hypothetical protein
MMIDRRMVLATIAVLALAAACGSPEPTPTPTSPPPAPTATATPTPAPSGAGETTGAQAEDGSAGGSEDAGGFDFASVTDPTDISQLPPETQEMATCMKETLGDERFGKVMIQVFERYYVPLDVDLALVSACGLTIRQVSNLGVEFGLGRL